MVDYAFIQQLATQYQTSVLNVMREYCQHMVLSCLYKQPLAHALLFKGGTSLRILYRPPRFSEDLDFTAYNISFSTIEKCIENTIQEMELYGIHVEIIESKHTTGGYLGIISCSLYSATVTLQIEISLRSRKQSQKQEQLVVNDYIPAYSITCLDENTFVQEKIEALLTRSKPRDWYDMYFMLRARMISQDQYSKIPLVIEHIKKDRRELDRELKQFLPKSHQLILKDFKNVLVTELERTVGK